MPKPNHVIRFGSLSIYTARREEASYSLIAGITFEGTEKCVG